MKLTWLGHATVVIDTAGGRLVTDPLLRSRVAHLRRHAAPVRAPEKVDVVLLSHLHYDHLDVPSLRKLKAPVVAPPGSERTLQRLHLEVSELAAGEQIAVGGAEVTAVRAVHDGRRSPLAGRRDDDSIGYLVEGDDQRVYFAGDTEVFAGMQDFGPLDAALVPIWGWGPRLGPGHMDPSQAAEALTLLRPAVAVPIHWGTFLPIGGYRRHHDLLHTPVEQFRLRAAELAPDVRIEVLDPGGSLVITQRG
ncbi:MAG TPA: MBL fold metallo-hydrolase [Thermoleophilaceae bacterium]|jgi:L-ascorbate metabolism protein UlaG (beta-lactamase superfamily)|nr:MBL fold metallo-hydrolase [Thermoleophilaceae bacterium]